MFLWDISRLYPEIASRFVQEQIFEALAAELGEVTDQDYLERVLSSRIIPIELSQENANQPEDEGLYDLLLQSTAWKSSEILELWYPGSV